jgi:hypothetical protein
MNNFWYLIGILVPIAAVASAIIIASHLRSGGVSCDSLVESSRLLALTCVGVRVVNFATAYCFYEPNITVTVSRSFCFVGFCNLYSISQLRA